MFFAKPGEYEPCKMFSIGHFVLLSITLIVVAIALFFTRKMNKIQTKKILRILIVFLWILEIIKIVFNLLIGNSGNPNNYIPLYYCSLILYAGLLSSFATNKLKKIGDVFISTGAIIGGLFFLFCPNTSLPAYPMFHYISFQSFIFHGIMLYLGLLFNITNYVNLKISDIKYYATLISGISFVSYIVNKKLETNFMFISDNFPNTPVELVYNLTGKFFTIVMIAIQVVGPFYLVYFIKWIIKQFCKNSKKELEVQKEGVLK